MADKLTISGAPPPFKSMDFAFLRDEGIKQIQEIVGNEWSDYNAHDPGVTILEALCYAITELAYKTNTDIRDILSDSLEDPRDFSKQFLTASAILPNNPLTISDYRKLIIDMPGIRNVWFEKSDHPEVELYWDNENQQTSFSGEKKIPILGLFDVLLEFEEHTLYGDLNHNIFKRTVQVNRDVELEVAFPFWDEVNQIFSEEIDFTVLSVEVRDDDDFIPFKDNVEQDYFVSLTINIPEVVDDYKLSARIKLNIKGNTREDEDRLKEAIIAELVRTDEACVLIDFNKKIVAVYSLIEGVKKLLHAHRNLCEDFIRFKAVRVQEIALAASIELKPGANISQVLANIFFMVHQYFSPKLNFYTLEELIQKGRTPDEIFTGPKLKHGFIDTEELIKLKNREVVYTSDLIRLMMRVDGVKAVMNVRISNYINNKILDGDVRNCLRLPLSNLYKPVLSIEKSGLQVMRDGVEHEPEKSLVLRLFEELKSTIRIQRKAPGKQDLEMKPGRSRKLSYYHSLQEDFPAVYGLRAKGLSKEVTPRRKAQAKQLKAYLLFFEQLMSNFLVQLSRTRDLFSPDEDKDQTYFTQTLNDVPDVAWLFVPFIKRCDEKGIKLEDYEKVIAEWQEFVQSQDNELATAIKAITEDDQTFSIRRNKFMDHLLARYSEDLREYTLLTYGKYGDDPDLSLEAIKDKSYLLRNYPSLSMSRGQAFDMIKVNANNEPDIWNSVNISGLEQRLAGLLGIRQTNRRNLSGNIRNSFRIYQEKDTDEIDEWRFSVEDTEGNILLSSSMKYTDLEKVDEEINSVIRFGGIKNKYKYIKARNGKYYFNLVDSTNEIIARRIEPFDTVTETKKEIDEVYKFFNGKKYDHEGFYLLEHILLRPRLVPSQDQTSKLLTADLDYSGTSESAPIDPYSFNITLIFPEWPLKFKDPDFRKFTEKTIRNEVPAHVFPQIYWLNTEEIAEFESLFRDWLESNHTMLLSDKNEITTINEKVNRLVKYLNKIRNQ